MAKETVIIVLSNRLISLNEQRALQCFSFSNPLVVRYKNNAGCLPGHWTSGDDILRLYLYNSQGAARLKCLGGFLCNSLSV